MLKGYLLNIYFFCQFLKVVDDFFLRQIFFFYFYVFFYKINFLFFQFIMKKNEKKEIFIDKLYNVVYNKELQMKIFRKKEFNWL